MAPTAAATAGLPAFLVGWTPIPNHMLRVLDKTTTTRSRAQILQNNGPGHLH